MIIIYFLEYIRLSTFPFQDFHFVTSVKWQKFFLSFFFLLFLSFAFSLSFLLTFLQMGVCIRRLDLAENLPWCSLWILYYCSNREPVVKVSVIRIMDIIPAIITCVKWIGDENESLRFSYYHKVLFIMSHGKETLQAFTDK